MAVVSSWPREIPHGTKASASFGESAAPNRRWRVKVDDPLTSKFVILASVGVEYGDTHPHASTMKALAWSVDPEDEECIYWIVDWTYRVPDPQQNPDPEGGGSGDPFGLEDYWEAMGAAKTIPCYRDFAGAIIVNSAGDPLEGLEKERNDIGYSHTRFYYTDASWKADAKAFNDTVNNGDWDWGARHCWKCEFKGARRKDFTLADGSVFSVVETQWEFRYDPETWRLMPWDIGFHQLVECGSGGCEPTDYGSERAPIETGDGSTVRHPVALNGFGVALPPGTPPLVINGVGVEVYEEKDFGAQWGTPSILGA